MHACRVLQLSWTDNDDNLCGNHGRVSRFFPECSPDMRVEFKGCSHSNTKGVHQLNEEGALVLDGLHIKVVMQL